MGDGRWEMGDRGDVTYLVHAFECGGHGRGSWKRVIGSLLLAVTLTGKGKGFH